MPRLLILTATPAGYIRIDRRILNQAQIFTDRGWEVTLALPGRPDQDAGVSLWEGCTLEPFATGAVDIGFLYELLEMQPGPKVDVAELDRLRTRIDTLPEPFVAGLFRHRDRDVSREELAQTDDFVAPYAITHGCLEVAARTTFDAMLVADYQGSVAASIVHRATGIPYILDFHEFALGQERRSATVKRLIHHVEALAIRSAFAFITISDFFGDLFRHQYGLRYRPLPIYNAPDFRAAAPAERGWVARTLSLPPNATTLLFHGGFQRRKRNIERLLRVAPALAAQEIHLVFLGYGDMEAEIRSAGPNVHLHGAVDQTEMARWVAGADACLIPYMAVEINQRFCTPNRFFDGLEVGTPVIANAGLEYIGRIIDAYGVGYRGPMETDEEMLATLRAAVDHVRAGRARGARWEDARRQYSFAVQRRTYDDVVARLEMWLALRDCDELNRLDGYALMRLGHRPAPPPSTVVANLMAEAEQHMVDGRHVRAVDLLSTALHLDPENQQLHAFVRTLGAVRPGRSAAPATASPPAPATLHTQDVPEHDASYYDGVYEQGGWNLEYRRHYSDSVYYPSWQVVADWIAREAPAHLLEIGCGPGQLAQMLFERGLGRYTGFDFSEKAIEMARARNPARAGDFHRADAYATDLLASDYSHVVVLEVLEHIERDLEILERVRPGTTVVYSVPSYSSRSHLRWFDSVEAAVARYANLVEARETRTVPLPGSANRLFLVKGMRR